MPGVTGSFRNPARRMVWAEGTHLPLSRGLRIILSGSNPPALTPCAGFLGLPQKTVPQARGLNNKNLFPQGPGCWKSPQSQGWLAWLVPSEAPLLGLCVCAMSLQSCPTLCDPTVACQASLSMGFSRQEYWSGLPSPPPGDLPDPGIEPTSLMYPALAGRFFTANATWQAPLAVDSHFLPASVSRFSLRKILVILDQCPLNDHILTCRPLSIKTPIPEYTSILRAWVSGWR